MVINLPTCFDRDCMYDLLEKVITEDLKPMDKEITFRFKTLEFIEPVGVAILANLVEWLHKRDVTCNFSIPKTHNSAIAYLDDSMFFERYLGSKLNENAVKRETTITLQNVTYQSSYQWLDSVLISWLSQRLNLTKISLANIKTCFSEIFNNIKDHSKENIGCVFAQHYPRLSTIRIAISDFGVGIPYNVQKIRPSIKDSEALSLATEHGFTTRSIPRNTGAGLDILTKNVVHNNRGIVYIHSNRGILTCSNINGEIHKIGQDIRGFYPGTLIDILLRTDTIDHVLNFEEEFEW